MPYSNCWGFLTDNGQPPYMSNPIAGSTPLVGPTFFNSAARTQEIPLIAESAMTQDTLMSLIDEVQSRLWVYDPGANNAWNAGTFTHRGRGLGVGAGTFSVGCSYNIGHLWDPGGYWGISSLGTNGRYTLRTNLPGDGLGSGNSQYLNQAGNGLRTGCGGYFGVSSGVLSNPGSLQNIIPSGAHQAYSDNFYSPGTYDGYKCTQQPDFTNVSINTYRYDIGNGTGVYPANGSTPINQNPSKNEHAATGFTKTPLTTYRIVDKDGYLLGAPSADNFPVGTQPRHPSGDQIGCGSIFNGGNNCLGDGITYISDNEFLVTTINGVWYTNTKWKYAGSSVKHRTKNNAVTATPAAPGNDTRIYVNNSTGINDLSAHSYNPNPGNINQWNNMMGRQFEDAWYACSYETGHKVETLIAVLVADLAIISEAMGDQSSGLPMDFDGAIPSFPVIPTGAITFINAEHPDGMPSACTPPTTRRPQVTLSVQYADSTQSNNRATTSYEILLPLTDPAMQNVGWVYNGTNAVDFINSSPIGGVGQNANLITSCPGAILPTTMSGATGYLATWSIPPVGASDGFEDHDWYLIGTNINPDQTPADSEITRYVSSINSSNDINGTIFQSPHHENYDSPPNNSFGAESINFRAWPGPGNLFNPAGTGPSLTFPFGNLAGAKSSDSLQFWGVGQCPSCVYTSEGLTLNIGTNAAGTAFENTSLEGHYECSIHGCISSWGLGEVTPKFTSFAACSASCVSYSCTSCCNPVAYDCPPIAGTGQTGTWLDQEDCDNNCGPQYHICTPIGCSGTTDPTAPYSSFTQCFEGGFGQPACESFGCEDNGCLRQDGTGGTYSTMTACTGTCFSYACQDGTCKPWNEPWYGSGGTYFDVRSPLSALTACTASTIPCVAWACGQSYIPVDTDIYVYYDTTSMSLANAQVAHNSIEQWAAQMPGYLGTVRHINISDERWVNWATIPYQQPTPNGLRCGLPATPIRRPQELRAWSQSQSSASRWYDGWGPGCNPSFVVNGVTHSFVGYPPLTNPNKNVLNVLFTDESDSHHSQGAEGIYYDVNRTFTNAPTWTMNPASEPSQPFKDDYTRYMSVWNDVQSAAGTIASFVYPTKPVNYNYWGSGTVSVFKYQALTVVAAIDSGNKVPQDGTWSGGTAPRRAGQGGVVWCSNSSCATLASPPLCTICDLTQLEASNVYWNGLTPTWGGLDQVGWGYNASFPQLTWQQMQTDLETFISSPVVVGVAGCHSATTSPNAVYPYSGEVACLNFCDPKYECLPNGCILNSTGGTYDTLASCTAACQSYSCSTVGCELWNPPNYGTGGTFIDLVSCDAGCVSWNCEDVGVQQQYVDGCIKQVGTGGTYFNVSNLMFALSACTASCTSWDCMYTPSQCTEYPNTGFTYSTSAACETSPACGGGWECTISGCILHTGTPPSGPNFYPNSASCIEHCVGWGCSADTIPANTNIYAYYTTDPSGSWPVYRDWLPSAHTSVMNWVATIPGFTGKVYHTVSSNERWMGYANSVYTGELPGGLFTYNPSTSPATSPCGIPTLNTPYQWGHIAADTMWMIDYGSQQVNSAYWYDDITPGQYPWTLGPITAKGLPPTAHTSANTLVLVFQKEATGNPWLDTISDCGDNYFIPNNINSPNGYWYGSGAYHNGQGFTSGGLYPGKIPQFSGGSVMSSYQPTNAWKKDYTGFTVNYSAVTGNSGTFKGFMFTPPREHVVNIQNLQHIPLHSSGDHSNFPLHSLGAITRGNNNVADGQYILGTAPRMSSAGGIYGGVPEICGTGLPQSITTSEFGVVLSQLELINPYWNQPAGTSYGRLYDKNWGIDITYEPWSDQRFTNALEPFLKSVSAAIITGTCVSAETLYTTSIQYPYSSETWCTGQCGSAEWLYTCTPTGCIQHPDGIMTLSECLNGGIVIGGVDYTGCISYSCGTQGCQLYNQPPTPPTPGINYYGTGGTFSAAFGPGELYRCWQMCASFVCNWDPSFMSYDDEGCKGVVGTGMTSTFPSLSACTGTCVSWDCNNPCDLQNIYAQYKPSGCTEYPNTGSTYTSSTACTDSCIRNWFCYSGSGIYNVTPQNGPFGPFPSNMANYSCATAVDIVPAVNDINDALDVLHANNGFGVVNWPYKPIGTWRFSQLLNPTGAQTCDSPYGGQLRIAKAITVQQLSGAFYSTWNDFITAAQGLNPTITLSHTPSSVLSLLNASNYMADSTNCICNSSGVPCTIDCSNTWPAVYTSSNPTPPVGATIFDGPYVTYSAASGVCCTGITVPPTSWSCKTGTDENSCDGLTLIPIPLTTVYNCYNWLTTNFPGGMFSAYTCELVTPPTTSTQCVGPNGGQLINLTEMTFQTDLNNSVTGFSNWNNFISHASTQLSPAVTNIISGQDIYTLEVNTYDVYCDGHFSYNSTGCTCTETACGCVELQNASGPYTSQTHCQLSCCTSGTSWNCINSNVPFQPICTGKTFVGEFNDNYSVLDFYRVNAPTSIFGLDRLVVNQPVSVGTGGNHLTMAEAMSNVSPNVQVEDCYYEDWVNYPMPPGSPNPGIYFKPYKYINEISHTLVNGGFGYHTWNSWRAAVVTEGVTLLVNDTAYDVCTKINAQLNAGNTPIPCGILLDSCCRQSDCYCYELFITGGTYTNEPDCLTVCCPPASNYECTPPQPGQSQGVCNPTTSPIGPNVYPNYNDCISACTGTTWYCFPGGSVAQVGGASNQLQIPGAGLYMGYYSNTTDCSNVWQDFFIYLGDWQAVPSRQYEQFSGYTTCLETNPPPPPTSLCACGTCGAIFGMDSLVVRWSCWPSNGPYTTLQNTAPYHHTTNPMGMPNTWAEVIEQLQNVIAPGGTFNLQMSYSQVEHAMMTELNGTGGQPCYTFYSFAPRKVNCIETNIPCNCYPCYNPNVCAYSSYTECIIPCCPTTVITYNCEINGCIDPLDGSGTFSGINALIDCQAVCWEWECDPGTNASQNCNNLIDLNPVYGPVRYDYGYDYNPPWLTPTWVQGGTRGNLIIDLFGNPNTLPAPHNILNSVTGMFNLQEQALSHYTLDATLGWPSALTGMSTSNWCDSLNGKKWRPQRIGILNRLNRDPLSTASPFNYVGPWTTYYDLIYWLVNNTDWCSDHGFPFGYCLEGSLLLEPWDVNNKLITTNTTAYGPTGPPQQLLNGELWLYGEPCLC